REIARADPDVVVLELPAEAHRQINALQRAATIVLQKSVRAWFDLGPAEAMWKGKPVVGGATGGVAHGITLRGAFAALGAAGAEPVRRAFLITRQLVDELALAIHLLR